MGLFHALRRGATLVTLGAAGGALLITTRHLLETPQPLISVLPGEARIDRKHGGDIYYNIAGPENAEPLVLLHDFYPGASNYEFREVFQALAARRRIYAPDWLGFGMSEHPSLAYTGEFYANVLMGFVRDVVARPATVVAHGRAANIAVRAASEAPGLFDRLILVSPHAGADASAEPTLAQSVVRGLQRVSLGMVPYALVSTRPVLHWGATARAAAAGEGASSIESIEHSYASAHQFGGHHAVLALMTGALDLSMRNALALLEPPVLLLGGASDRLHPLTDLQDLAVLNPNAEFKAIPDAGDTVYRDQPDAFISTVTQWLAAPHTRHQLDSGALVPPIEQEHAAVATPAAASTAPAMAERDTGASAAASSLSTPIDVEPEEPLTGTPGYVVPGVSDMGLDALATVTYGGVGNIAPSATPEAAESHNGTRTAADETTPEALLPEAGAAGPADTGAEHPPLEGQEPLDLYSNIADVASATQLEQSGDVEGLPVQSVMTPETEVATPDRVETPESGVSTAENSVIAGAEHGEAAGSADSEHVTPLPARPPNPTRPRTAGGSQSTRSAPRAPGAHMEGTKGKARSASAKSKAAASDAPLHPHSAKRHAQRKHDSKHKHEK